MVFAAFVAYVLGTKRAVQAQGSPTPAERKIAVEVKAELDANAQQAAATAAKVQNASTDDLVLVTRDQLLDDAATVAGADKPAD